MLLQILPAKSTLRFSVALLNPYTAARRISGSSWQYLGAYYLFLATTGRFLLQEHPTQQQEYCAVHCSLLILLNNSLAPSIVYGHWPLEVGQGHHQMDQGNVLIPLLSFLGNFTTGCLILSYVHYCKERQNISYKKRCVRSAPQSYMNPQLCEHSKGKVHKQKKKKKN